MKKVIAFGAFDPVHEGHKHFLQSAKQLGDHLLVVVARDASIAAHKNREAYQSEEQRLEAVAALPFVDEAILGNKTARTYELLSELEFDVIALGYDQEPSEDVVKDELARIGKHGVEIVRLPPFEPETYKSSLIRPT